MPTPMKNFFAAQGVNPLLDLKLDDWLGVAHVDEVAQLGADAKHVLVADTELAWALALWAVKLNPNVRMHPKMNSNDQLPGYTSEGILVRDVIANAAFRTQNLDFAQAASHLRGVRDALRKQLGLTDEVSLPARVAANTGTIALARAGAFTSMLNGVKRFFEIRFLDADRYQLRYHDEGKASSKWFDGRRSRDEVFTDAKAYLLKTFWTGTAKAGDRITFATNPAATMIKMPVFFASFGVLFDAPGAPPPPGGWRLAPFSSNHINSLVVDNGTVVSPKAYGPKVNFDGSGTRDLFEAYATSAFRAAGYKTILFTDARLYHDAGGSLHCGTNVIRTPPATRSGGTCESNDNSNKDAPAIRLAPADFRARVGLSRAVRVRREDADAVAPAAGQIGSERTGFDPAAATPGHRPGASRARRREAQQAGSARDRRSDPPDAAPRRRLLRFSSPVQNRPAALFRRARPLRRASSGRDGVRGRHQNRLHDQLRLAEHQVDVREAVRARPGWEFPAPRRILEFSERELAARTACGYRAKTILTVARMFAGDKLPLDEWAAKEEFDRIAAALEPVWGIGPYALSHILVLLGDYRTIPVDSEIIKYLRQTHFNGRKVTPKRAVEPYERFGDMRFLAFKFGRMSRRENYID
jgi:hypothetical protein